MEIPAGIVYSAIVIAVACWLTAIALGVGGWLLYSRNVKGMQGRANPLIAEGRATFESARVLAEHLKEPVQRITETTRETTEDVRQNVEFTTGVIKDIREQAEQIGQTAGPVWHKLGETAGPVLDRKPSRFEKALRLVTLAATLRTGARQIARTHRPERSG